MVHMCLLDHNARLEIFTQSNISVKKSNHYFIMSAKQPIQKYGNIQAHSLESLSIFRFQFSQCLKSTDAKNDHVDLDYDDGDDDEVMTMQNTFQSPARIRHV